MYWIMDTSLLSKGFFVWISGTHHRQTSRRKEIAENLNRLGWVGDYINLSQRDNIWSLFLGSLMDCSTCPLSENPCNMSAGSGVDICYGIFKKSHSSSCGCIQIKSQCHLNTKGFMRTDSDKTGLRFQWIIEMPQFSGDVRNIIKNRVHPKIFEIFGF